MIIWNAFYKYFLERGNTPKYIALGILIGLFLFKRWGISEWCRTHFSKISQKKWLLLILVIGFLLRLAWIFWSPYSPPAAGTEDYVMIRHAQDLVAGNGYVTTEGAPSADRPIGYAILLAGIFKAFGENLDWVALMNAFLSLVTIWLVYRLGLLLKNELVGLLAAFFVAIYPTSIFASRIVLEEHVFIPMWLGGIYLLIRDYQNPSWKKLIGAGLLFGIGAHMRTFSFAMGLVVFLMWLFAKKKPGQAILRALIIQAIILIFAVPWAIRNQQKLGEPVLYTTWIGAALYFSNNDTSDVRYPINPTREQGGDLAFSKAQTEIERNRAGKNAAFEWIKTHPVTFLQKAIGRLIYMLGLTREGWTVTDNFNTIKAGRTRPSDKAIKKLNKADNDYYGTIFLLAVFGTIIFLLPGEMRSHQAGIGYLFLTLAYYFSIIALTMGHRKYRFAIEPFFCLLAAYGISFFFTPPKRIES